MSDITEIANKRGVKAESQNGETTLIRCKLDGKQINMLVFHAKGHFQINIGDLLSIDKIEEQQLGHADVEEIVGGLLDLMQAGKLTLYRHNLAGFKAYNIKVTGEGSGFTHQAYESISEWLVKRITPGKLIGKLKPENS